MRGFARDAPLVLSSIMRYKICDTRKYHEASIQLYRTEVADQLQAKCTTTRAVLFWSSIGVHDYIISALAASSWQSAQDRFQATSPAAWWLDGVDLVAKKQVNICLISGRLMFSPLIPPLGQGRLRIARSLQIWRWSLWEVIPALLR